MQWGSRSCSTGSVKLYDNFMAGSKYDHRGSGYNALCMHPSPQWPPGASTANNNGNLLYGTESEVQGAKKDMAAACAVCLAPHYVKTYVQWGCAPALWTGGHGWRFGCFGCRLRRSFTASHAACEQVSGASESRGNRVSYA